MAEAAVPSQTTSVPAGSCPTVEAQHTAPPLFQNGELTFQAHHVGWIVASFFSIVATAVSIWLIVKHLSWYTNPKQQRQIVRLLLMVPIYAIISCLAYFFWNHAVPLALIRDAYEGIILAAFFYLLLQYLAPTPAEQKEYFRTYKLKKWAWPFGWVKTKPDGLYFLQLMKWAIIQYCWVRPFTSFAAVIMNWIGIYCEQSWSPRFGSVWILIIVSISVSVAMFCLIQFYLAISDRIKQYKPLLQLFSIKAIIFLMFWQTSFLSALHSFNVIKDTKYMTAVDINVGFAALLQTLEMVIFAFMHVRCFSYIPYRKPHRSQQTKKGASFRHALNFGDFWRETRDGWIYMWRTLIGKEAEFEARRRTHFERAMGKSRNLAGVKKDLPPEPHGEVDDDDSDGEGDDFLVPNSKLLGDAPRRRSIEHLPEKRPKTDGVGYATKSALLPTHADEEMAMSPGANQQRSWWSRVYGRLSGDDQISEENVGRHPEHDRINVALPLGPTKGRVRDHAMGPVDLDEPPPPSLLGKGEKRRQKSGNAQGYDGLPNEKRPFLDWDPTYTQPPRIPDPTLRLSPNSLLDRSPPVVGDPSERSEKLEQHQRDDSLLGRIFARSSEHSTHEAEHVEKPGFKLPSLFQRKQDVASEVKGWNFLSPKALPAEPIESPSTPVPVPITSPARVVEPADLPSIPSPSPSPPRAPPKVHHQGAPHQVLQTPASPPTPAQPTPILHQSLSYARRPSLLIADEAGMLPPLDLKPAQPQPEERTQSWVKATHKHIKPLVAPPPPPPPQHSQFGRMYGPPGRGNPTAGPPLSGSQRHRGYYPTRGPRKPEKIVMPTPLSPARFPGGEPVVARASHGLPPGAGYGVPPPNAGYGVPSAPIQFPLRVNPYVYAEPAAIEPYEMYTTQNWAPRPVPPPVPAAPPRHSRVAQRDQGPGQHSQRRKRSPSPFGIQAPTSDAESLPRHPALRQQTARRRRESQPLPEAPADERSTAQSGGARRATRRRSEPLQSSYNADMSSSPTLSAGNLLNSSTPASPLSAHGDSRYPRASPRSNYFDRPNSTNPYLTTLMNDAIAPVIPASSLPTPSTPARRIKRR